MPVHAVPVAHDSSDHRLKFDHEQHDHRGTHTVEHTVYNVLLSSTAAPEAANAHNLKFRKESVKGLHDQRVSPR